MKNNYSMFIFVKFKIIHFLSNHFINFWEESLQDKDLGLFDSQGLCKNHIFEHLMPRLPPKISVHLAYRVETRKIC